MNTAVAVKYPAVKYHRNIVAAPLSEEMEDSKLLHLMKAARNEGLADTAETLAKLGIRL